MMLQEISPTIIKAVFQELSEKTISIQQSCFKEIQSSEEVSQMGNIHQSDQPLDGK
jgi:hypothetical protein